MTDITTTPLGEQALEKEKDQISIEQLEHHSHGRSGEYAPAYLEFGTMKTVKAFWKATLFSMLVAVGAIFDAYAVTSERHP